MFIHISSGAIWTSYLQHLAAHESAHIDFVCRIYSAPILKAKTTDPKHASLGFFAKHAGAFSRFSSHHLVNMKPLQASSDGRQSDGDWWIFESK